MRGVLDALLEGFAPAPHPPEWKGKFRPGDHVRVKAGKDSIVGRLVRPSDARPDTHVVVAPKSGGPHVEAKLSDCSMDSPVRHAREAAKAQAEAQQTGAPMGKPGAKPKLVLGARR